MYKYYNYNDTVVKKELGFCPKSGPNAFFSEKYWLCFVAEIYFYGLLSGYLLVMRQKQQKSATSGHSCL